MIRYKLITLFLFSLLFLSSSRLQPVFAEKSGLSAYPPIITITTQLPISLKVPLQINNTSPTPLSVSVEMIPFKTTDKETGLPVYETDQAKISAWQNTVSSHVGLYDNGTRLNSFILSGNEKKSLTVQINLDETTALDDDTFSFIFTTNHNRSDQKLPKVSSVIETGIATHVLISPKGDEKPQVQLSEPFLTSYVQKTTPVLFPVLLRNTSNHLISLSGSLKIKNMLTGLTTTIPLQTTTLLGDSEGYMYSTSNDFKVNQKDFSITSNSVSATNAVAWHPKILFGVYKATVSLNSETQANVVRNDTYFIGISVKPLIILLLIVLFLILLNKRANELRK